MSKYHVIHKTGSTRRITTPPEEDRATATVNMHNNTGKDRTCMTNTTSSSCLPKKSTIPASYLQPPITASAFGKQSISSYTANPPHRYQPPLLALHLQTALPLFPRAKYPNFVSLSPATRLRYEDTIADRLRHTAHHNDCASVANHSV